jgi:hypothetical protein
MNHTWVQPWHRPLIPLTGGSELCKHPVGPWLPRSAYRAWSFRIRPDLATKVIPTFPYHGFTKSEWISILQKRTAARSVVIIF